MKFIDCFDDVLCEDENYINRVLDGKTHSRIVSPNTAGMGKSSHLVPKYREETPDGTQHSSRNPKIEKLRKRMNPGAVDNNRQLGANDLAYIQKKYNIKLDGTEKELGTTGIKIVPTGTGYRIVK